MLVRDQWSRQWAHWDGATASIDQAFVLRFMGVKKTKRNDVVVVRVAHFHQPGQLERMELQLTGCELIANHTKARAGELSGLSSLRHAQKAPEGSLFQVVVSVRMTLSCCTMHTVCCTMYTVQYRTCVPQSELAYAVHSTL